MLVTKCVKCSNELNSDCKYCSVCGEKVLTIDYSKEKKILTKLHILNAIIVVLALFNLGFMMSDTGDPNSGGLVIIATFFCWPAIIIPNILCVSSVRKHNDHNHLLISSVVVTFYDVILYIYAYNCFHSIHFLNIMAIIEGLVMVLYVALIKNKEMK